MVGGSRAALLVLAVAGGKAMLSKEHACVISINGIDASPAPAHGCQVALFSAHASFSIAASVDVIAGTLCDGDTGSDGDICSESQGSVGGRVALVKRGGCAFDTKANAAASRGYRAILISNSEGEGIFPMGAASAEYESAVPAAMVDHGFAALLSSRDAEGDVCSKHAANVTISYTRPQRSPSFGEDSGESDATDSESALAILIERGGCAVLVLLVVATVIQHHIPLRDASALAAIAESLIAVAILAFFILSRSSTFRTLPALGPSEPVRCNHMETDERIFEALVDSVLADPLDYRLSASTIRALGLSRENYSTGLFSHPPFFVYFTAGLRCLGLSAPAVALLLHVATLLCIPLIVHGLLSPRSGDAAAAAAAAAAKARIVSFLAAVIFACCPISAFCSQKIWIDNALMATCTAAVATHVNLANYRSSKVSPVLLSFVSALFVAGGLALNTKVTALALLPFLLAQSVSASSASTPGAAMSRRDFFPVAMHLVAISSGLALAHGPWMYAYWLSSGRLAPNAWPSPSLVAGNAFVRLAVEKPAHTYARTLLLVAPVHMVGLLHASALVAKGAAALIAAFRRGVNRPSVDRLEPLSMWPLCLVGGLTLLGAMGAGFQTRFILPALPATSILSAVFFHETIFERGAARRGAAIAVLLLLLAHGATLAFYYSVLYAPLYADIDGDGGVFGIISTILSSPFHPPRDKVSFDETLLFMRHFGLDK